MLAGTNLDNAKRFNRRVVLEMVRLHGPLCRAEIARRTGLAAQTVSNIVSEFGQAGLLLERVRQIRGRGQPPIDLTLNPNGGFTFGVAFDSQRLMAVMVDVAGGVRGQIEIPVVEVTSEAILSLVQIAIQRLIERSAVRAERLWGCGVVMPAIFDGGRLVVVGRTDFTGWQGFPLAKELTRRLGIPILIDNDATAAAVGEHFYGRGRAYRDFAYIYLGAGLGAGLIVGGQTFRGVFGKAGEIGHVIVEPGGRPCSCGNRGCLERYLSLTAAQASIAGEAEAKAIEPLALTAALVNGDRGLHAWLDEAAGHLRNVVVMLENLLDLETTIIGGPAPEPIVDALIARAQPLPRSVSSDRQQGTPRLLKADPAWSTPALGAAALPVFDTLNPTLAILSKGSANLPGYSRNLERWAQAGLPSSEKP